MKKVVSLLLVASWISCTALAGQLAVDRDSTQRISDRVKVLASDDFEGRQPNTPGATKAVAYIVQQFKDVGLALGGEGGTWFQQVPVNVQRVQGAPKASITVNGKEHVLSRSKEITVQARSYLAHVKLKNVPMVFAGYGIHRPEKNWDDFAGVDVRGKVIVIFAAPPPKGPSFDDFDNYASVREKQMQAAAVGAAGMLVVDTSDKDNWETTWRQGLWPQIELPPEPGDPAISPDFVGAVRRATLKDLMHSAGIDLDALEAAAAKPGFRAVPLGGMTFSGDYRMSRESFKTPTVIGKIEGAKRPDEVVIYSAHWDHLGRGKVTDYIGRNVLARQTTDDIYNGAVDNAAGVVSIIDIAQQFKAGPKPDRSIVFMAFTEEEPGLVGSNYYVHHPVYPLVNTIADLNIDTVPVKFITKVSIVGGGKSTLEDDFTAIAGTLGYEVIPSKIGTNYFRRSDQYQFAKAGVPVLFIGSGGADFDEPPSSAQTLAFSNAYGEQDYHHVSDEWRADWDFRGAAEISRLLYAVGHQLAFSDEWPSWKSGIPFRHLHGVD